MGEVVKTYKQTVPAVRFIGSKYGDKDRVDGSFAEKWNEWLISDRFKQLEALATEEYKQIYEDALTSIGLMRWKEGEEFEYYIGMFLPEGTEVPDGYDHVDFSASNFGVCWLHGTVPGIYGQEDKCAKQLSEEGFEITRDNQGALWFFERYGCPRFTKPDESGKVILDICYFVK